MSKVKERKITTPEKETPIKERKRGRQRVRKARARDPAKYLIPKDDFRRVGAQVAVVALPGTKNSVIIDTVYDGDTIIAMIWGYVSAALQRGYLANAPDPNYPFWAANYLTDILNNYISGTTQKTTSLPLWLLKVCRALSPKDVPSAHHGVTNYKVSYDALAFPGAALYPISPPVYGYNSLLWVPGTTQTNMFPNATAPTSYTEDQGVKAWNSVSQFMSNVDPVLAQQNKMVPASTKTDYDRNVSAQSVVSQVTGWGAGSSGGQDFQVQLEVPIKTPILAVLNKPLVPPAQVQAARSANYAIRSSGTPMSLGAYLPGLFPMEYWNTRKAPHYMFVDFLEFADVLAQYVQLLQTQKATGLASQTAITDPAPYQCPLTLQEMQLLLRNEIMYVMGVSQAGGQSILPRVPLTTNSNEFVPLASGTTTCATTSVGMKLPKAFVENIKSLSFVNGNLDRKGKKVKYSPTFYIPVLGKYESDALVPEDYIVPWDIQSTPTPLPAFKSDSSVVIRDTKSGKMIVSAEVPIDLIDGASASNYVFINDTTRLQSLAGLWNDWIVRLEEYSSQMTTVTTDGGMKILGAIFTCRHWAEPSITAKLRSADVVDTRIARKREMSSTVYANREVFALSAGCRFISGTDTFLRTWVLPINRLSPVDTNQNATGFVRMQSIMEHPSSLVTSPTGDEGVSMAVIHKQYASALIRGTATPMTEWDSIINSLDSTGHAGILSSLASAVGGAIFGPEVGATIGHVGSSLGL